MRFSNRALDQKQHEIESIIVRVQDRYKSLHSTNRASSEFYSALGPPFGSSSGFHHLEAPLSQAVGRSPP